MAPLSNQWFKASRSGSAGQCVQARLINGVVEVRNSNHPDAGTLQLAPAMWQTFIEAIVDDGEFRTF